MVSLTDWKFWLFVIGVFNVFLTIFSFVIQREGLLKVLENEIKHLQEDIKEIKKDLKKFTKKVIQLETLIKK